MFRCGRYSSVAEIPPMASLSLPVPVQLRVHHRVHLVLHLSSGENRVKIQHNGMFWLFSLEIALFNNSWVAFANCILRMVTMYHLTRNIIPSLLLTFPVMVAHLDAVCISYCERIGCIFSSAQDCHNCQIMVTNHLQRHKLLQGRHFAGLIRICYRQPHPIFMFPSDILVGK